MATGGTLKAAIELVEKIGGVIRNALFLSNCLSWKGGKK